jgi:hypothetical protein
LLLQLLCICNILSSCSQNGCLVAARMLLCKHSARLRSAASISTMPYDTGRVYRVASLDAKMHEQQHSLHGCTVVCMHALCCQLIVAPTVDVTQRMLCCTACRHQALCNWYVRALWFFELCSELLLVACCSCTAVQHTTAAAIGVLTVVQICTYISARSRCKLCRSFNAVAAAVVHSTSA